MKFLLSVILLFISTFTWANEEAKAAFLQGNEAYEKGDFTSAIQHYESALNSSTSLSEHSGSMWYNLGNAYYKTDQMGKAMLYWNKAHRLSPNNNHIRKNIAIGRSEIKGDVIPIRPFFLVNWWNRLQGMMSSQYWGIAGLVLLIASVLGGLLWLFGKTRVHKKRGFVAGIALLLGSIFLFLLAFSRYAFENDTNRGVVMVEKTILHPNPDAPGDFKIYEGTEVEILDQIGEWRKVRLLNSDVGWIKKEELEQI